MLADFGRQVEAAQVLLLHTGAVPGLGREATRLILDVREWDEISRTMIRAEPGQEAIAGTFLRALCWPRAHLGKDFSALCLALAGMSVLVGGQVGCAVRRQKGAASLSDMMKRLFGNVAVVARDRGYHLHVSVRTDAFDQTLAHEIMRVGYEITHPNLDGLVLQSIPGVFSRRKLDEGTAALLAVAKAIAADPRRHEVREARIVLDLCAGIGPLGLWAASSNPFAHVFAVESNVLAAAMLRENADRLGLGGRVSVFARDGLRPPIESGLDIARGAVDLALVNPPTHSDPSTLEGLLAPLRSWLRPEAPALLVVARPRPTVDLLKELGAVIRGGERDGYTIIEARW